MTASTVHTNTDHLELTMLRFAYVFLDIALVATLLWVLATDPSWWLLTAIPLLAVAAGLQAMVFSGFTLDAYGTPVSGRDADRYMRYRASLRDYERAEHDARIARNAPSRRP